jgi:hypothetical protein
MAAASPNVKSDSSRGDPWSDARDGSSNVNKTQRDKTRRAVRFNSSDRRENTKKKKKENYLRLRPEKSPPPSHPAVLAAPFIESVSLSGFPRAGERRTYANVPVENSIEITIDVKNPTTHRSSRCIQSGAALPVVMSCDVAAVDGRDKGSPPCTGGEREGEMSWQESSLWVFYFVVRPRSRRRRRQQRVGATTRQIKTGDEWKAKARASRTAGTRTVEERADRDDDANLDVQA